eukprot:TRINITY_DN4950_c0_g1_i3.p1 TRINITY_DN4950_c0_g1~~TRINITY_DN4950_c0_g1_i3.p1  ORF type:complete len:142 (+),score=27.87 TRINITY_DN4950_c0_g1_i3:807-1232(+)
MKGDSTRVDLMVGDIYGEDSEKYKQLGLSANVIASSFGKVTTVGGNKPDPSQFKPEDMVRSLLFTISNNISQIAFLNAQMLEIEKVFFAGGFVQDNPLLRHRLSYGIKFWSKNKMEALFLRHDGYLGAIGALTSAQAQLQI